MKRNILLAFLLIGLVVIEWGCEEIPRPCSSGTFNVLRIDSTAFYERDTNNYLSAIKTDSVNYQTLVIQVVFKTELVAQLLRSSSVYATPPCFPPSINWSLRNISVNEVNDGYSTKWQVSWRIQDGWFYDLDSIRGNEFREVPIQMYLKPKVAPIKKGSYSFNIIIETEEGEIFETTTEPIIIKP